MFNAYFLDRITLIETTGSSTWGEKSTKETIINARVDYKNRMVRNFAGEQVVSAALVHMKNRVIDPSTRIKINDIEHPILNIIKRRAFSKGAMLEVQIG